MGHNGNLLCPIGTSMQWGHNGTPTHNERVCNGTPYRNRDTMEPQWDPNGTPYCNRDTTGPQWDPISQQGHNGTPQCTTGTFMEQGHNGTPTHNGFTMGPHSALRESLCNRNRNGPHSTMGAWGHKGTPMGWDPPVHYKELCAMGTQRDPKVQWGCEDMMGPQHVMGMLWDP